MAIHNFVSFERKSIKVDEVIIKYEANPNFKQAKLQKRFTYKDIQNKIFIFHIK